MKRDRRLCTASAFDCGHRVGGAQLSRRAAPPPMHAACTLVCQQSATPGPSKGATDNERRTGCCRVGRTGAHRGTGLSVTGRQRRWDCDWFKIGTPGWLRGPNFAPSYLCEDGCERGGVGLSEEGKPYLGACKIYKTCLKMILQALNVGFLTSIRTVLPDWVFFPVCVEEHGRYIAAWGLAGAGKCN